LLEDFVGLRDSEGACTFFIQGVIVSCGVYDLFRGRDRLIIGRLTDVVLEDIWLFIHCLLYPWLSFEGIFKLVLLIHVLNVILILNLIDEVSIKVLLGTKARAEAVTWASLTGLCNGVKTL
jgi:hypothetical protein